MNSFFSNFMYAFDAIMPIVLLILLGYFLKKFGVFGESFFDSGIKFAFRAALPTYLFYEVYSVKSIKNIEWKTSAFALSVILILFFAGMFFAKFFVTDEKQKGVVVQCCYRSNFAVLGLSLAKALENNANPEAANGGTVEVLTAVSIPLFNVLACIALSMYVSKTADNKIDWKSVGLKILKNPLIIGIVLGLCCLFVRELIPVSQDGTPVFTLENNLPVIYAVVRKVANIAPGFTMIALGGMFNFADARGMKNEILLSTFLRTVFAPLVGVGLAFVCSEVFHIVDFGAEHYIAFIALFASPVATSSAIMAKEMGDDDALANQLVLWTSVASVFTVFAIVIISRTVGII